MPRYDYVCNQCAHRFELRQSFNSDPVAACPICEGESSRQFHAPPVIFKGSGWYVNDYGKGRGNNGAGPDKDSTEKKETGVTASAKESSSKPDSKPESTTAPAKSE